MLDEFEIYLQKEKRYSEHTVKAYLNDLSDFVDFIQIEDNLASYKEVNKQLIRSWMVSLINQQLEAKSVNRKLTSLRTFFKWLKSSGKINENPTSTINGPKVSKRIPEFVQESHLEVNKVKSLFTDDFCGQRDALLFELLYQTGIRLNELIQLKEKDVGSNLTIKVLGKRNKERIIAISEELYAQIEKFIEIKKANGYETSNILTTDKGKILYPKFVYRKINSYLSRVSSLKKKSPHVLRHTFATHLLNNGAKLEVLKEILGHESLAATQIYTHNSFAKINEIYKQAHPRGHKK